MGINKKMEINKKKKQKKNCYLQHYFCMPHIFGVIHCLVPRKWSPI
jgi:hypothetical protein